MRSLFITTIIVLSFNQAKSQNYLDDLQKLNTYLKDISDGFYGQFEVKDNFIILNFKKGKYCKFKIQDMADPVIDKKYGQLNFDCIGNKYCVITDWNYEGEEIGLLFKNDGTYNLKDLYELLLNFKKSYLSTDK